MKKLILSLVAIATISLSSFGQAPEGFKYQAVLRDAGNLILNNQAVGMQLTIQQGSVGGTAVYTETFTPTTNGYGLVNLEIGSGTTTDDFTTIDWANGPFFMETAVDVTGGTSYAVMGTSQLMSVPYALYAKTSGNGAGPQGPAGNDGIDGVDGAIGATGPQGPAGNDGAVGATGAQGATGPQGADGATGPQGATGLTGAQGPNGLTGPVGVTGAVGADGTNGTDGVDGIDGAAGATGAQGPIGLTGATGSVGATGATGPQGSAGANGLDGAPGATGLQGPAGANGLDGAPGATGPQGPAGQGGVTTAGSGINITGAGTVASPYVVSTTSACGLAIGQTYQGGIIFYLDASGCHGLISAPTDQSTGIQWYSGSYTDTYASGSGLFDGDGNCYRIRRSQGDCANCNAAELCLDLTLGGYSDWYLPSKYELNLMYRNIGQGNALGLGNVGGFANSYYWSSTEFGNLSAWEQNFNVGVQYSSTKFNYDYVRAVRAF